MNRSLSTIFLGVAIVLAVMSSTLFVVYESDRGIITRLGGLLKDKEDHVRIFGPGLHWKLPLIDRLHVFDNRLNMAEIPTERIVTKEKEVLMVAVFVQWRIMDFALFYNTTQGIVEGVGSRDRAEQLLRQNVKGALHAEFGQRTIENVISGERHELMESLIKRIDEGMQGYGMQVVDVRMSRVDYPPEVNDKVFARMSSERKQVAVRFRASGEAKAAKIRAEADRNSRVMIAEAEKEAEQLRGEGDAKASEIYAKSYSKAPEFFEFYRTLEAYNHAFKNKDDVLVLKPEGDFFKFFKNRNLIKETQNRVE